MQKLIAQIEFLLGSVRDLHSATKEMLTYRLYVLEAMIENVSHALAAAQERQTDSKLSPDSAAMTFDVLLAPEGAYLRFPHRQAAPAESAPFVEPGDGFRPTAPNELEHIVRSHVIIHDRFPRPGFRERALWALREGCNNIVEVVPVDDEAKSSGHMGEMDKGELDAFDEMFTPNAQMSSGDFGDQINATLAELTSLTGLVPLRSPSGADAELMSDESPLSRAFDVLSRTFGFMLGGEEEPADLRQIMDEAENCLRQYAEQGPDASKQVENMFTIIESLKADAPGDFSFDAALKSAKVTGLGDLFSFASMILPKSEPIAPAPRTRRKVERKK